MSRGKQACEIWYRDDCNVSTYHIGNIVCKYTVTNMEMNQNFGIIFHTLMSTESVLNQ